MTHKVLLVEDQFPFLIMALLKRYEDFDIITAGDGVEAIEVFRVSEPDIVLLDLRLPKLHGHVVLDAIRKIDPDLPVIVVSAFDDKKAREESFKRGANAFFRKPPDIRKLHMEMTRLLGQRVAKLANRPDPSRTMILDERQAVLLAKMRRLNKLKEKQALYGMNVPTELLLEIEDTEADIEQLRRELGE